MRYERPELLLLGSASAVVLGDVPLPTAESVDSREDLSQFGYDE
jgi:hypothetical protein